MKTVKTFATFFFVMIYMCLLTITAVAQDTKEEKQKEEDGTIRIRIEKYENGKKKVIEKTYKAGENPDLLWGNGFLDDNSLFDGFGKDFQFFSDSSFHGPSGFYFKTDSLPSHAFNYSFGLDKNNLDSLMQNQLNNSQIIIMDMNKRLKGMNIDSMMRLHSDSMKDFNFQWNEPDLNFQWQDGNDDLNLLLDKDLYDIEEMETEKGKKMLKIKPKEGKDNKEGKNSKKLRESMQLYPSNFTLYANQADGKVTVNLNLPEEGTTTITVENSNGKEVYKEKLKNFSGKYVGQIDLSKEGSGVFVVKVNQNDRNISRKIQME